MNELRRIQYHYLRKYLAAVRLFEEACDRFSIELWKFGWTTAAGRGTAVHISKKNPYVSASDAIWVRIVRVFWLARRRHIKVSLKRPNTDGFVIKVAGSKANE